jgi:nitrite reductase/ring-hydroxylating ferredoxin subunit
MNKLFVFILFFALSCNSESVNNNKNPNIPNYSFNIDFNLNLPSNSNLQFVSNHIVNYTVGARGIVVFNTGTGYVAFDLACPNAPFDSCTEPMDIDGIEAVCDCDDTTYNLFSGQAQGQQYPLKQYRVEVNGNIIRVYN